MGIILVSVVMRRGLAVGVLLKCERMGKVYRDHYLSPTGTIEYYSITVLSKGRTNSGMHVPEVAQIITLVGLGMSLLIMNRLL